jgi:hypothetical protein
MPTAIIATRRIGPVVSRPLGWQPRGELCEVYLVR